MNYKESMEYMESLQTYGSVLGLDTMRELMELLGNPQDELKFIHVAGTNGKGSVCSLLNSILTEAGLKTGVYTSPSVFAYLEKYKIGRKNISQKTFSDVLTRVAKVSDAMKVHPTPFEIETAVAFVAFMEAGCDIVILECGLGGEGDATNVVETALLNVFTSISLDHTGILGDTLFKIADNKAGIMRRGVPCVSYMPYEDGKCASGNEIGDFSCDYGEVKKALQRRAEATSCTIEYALADAVKIKKQSIDGSLVDVRISGREYKDLKIALSGCFQIGNALVALKAALMLSSCFEISDSAIRRGFMKVVHPGRFEVIHKSPAIIIDGAHNPDAAWMLKNTCESILKERRIIMIMGVFADKQYDEIARVMTPLANQVITVATPENSRALPSLDLAACVMQYNSNVSSASSVEEALEVALLFAEKKDIILAFGSLSYLGLLKKAVRKI